MSATPNPRAALRRWLHAQRVTQTALAAAVGVEQSAVSRWLDGSRRPLVEAAVSLERATRGAVRFEWWYRGTTR